MFEEMTLSDTVRLIETCAGNQPAVRSIVRNDIFRLNSLPDAKYAVFGWTQGQHLATIDAYFYTFRFTFFYIDRLTADRSNEVEIQSVGIQVLENVLRMLADRDVLPDGDWVFTTFNQRFEDDCAGVFCSVALTVPIDFVCSEGYFDFNNDFNDDFTIY